MVDGDGAWTGDDVVVGEVASPGNMSIDDGAGSIHHDGTAQSLGFAAGTVAADVHVEQFPPVLLELFGPEWFETGSLSLYFKAPTAHREPVVVQGRRVADGAAEVRLLRADAPTGAPVVVAVGSAAVGADQPTSALRSRDLRAADPDELVLLGGLRPGTDLGTFTLRPTADRQRRRLATGEMTAPLPWYGHESPWGGAIASPQTLTHLMAMEPGHRLQDFVHGETVGMWGACEIRQFRPVFIDADYVVSGRVVEVSRSPRSEIIWFEAAAHDSDEQLVATLFMQSRVLPVNGADGGAR